MEFDTKKKFKAELRSFFGLTVLNLMIGAIILALGISLAITNVLDIIETGQIALIPIVQIGLGVAAIAAGFYWIIQIAEIMDGMDYIKTTFDELGEGDGEKATSLIIKMMAHYRSNKTTISRMIVLGRIGGALFLIAGAFGMISAGASIADSGILAENIGQLIGGLTAFGVGIAGLLISRYFSIYSRVWDARLQETAKVEDALEHEMGAN
jgi:hypothetical protein